MADTHDGSRPFTGALTPAIRSTGSGASPAPACSCSRSASTPRLSTVFAADEHLAVKLAWVIYQKIITAYADPNRHRGKHAMSRLIASIHRGVPAGLEEIAQLGRTLWRRRDDILAFLDHHAMNGPTEAIDGRLEALRHNALGFRNPTNYRWRSLLHSGALHQLVNTL